MEITDIKNRLSILKILSTYSLTPDRNKRICCPFHDDKTPSMQVYPETNTVYCFSSNCKLHGKAIDQIDFIMHKENCTKHEAILKAKSLLNYSSNSRQMNEPQEQSLTELFTQQRKSLHRTKKAIQYLKDRNLYPVESGKAGTKLFHGVNPLKAVIGFNSYQSGWKQLQNCITFPLKDREENITSLYGRSIADKKGKQSLLPQKQERTLSGLSTCRNENHHHHRSDYRRRYDHNSYRLPSAQFVRHKWLERRTLQKRSET